MGIADARGSVLSWLDHRRGPAGAALPKRLRLVLTGFGRSRSGATSVEFAMISVPFLGLLFALFQTCLVFLMQQGLRAALDNAARQVLTGQSQNNSAVSSWQNFRDTYICPAAPATRLLPSFITCANIVIDIRPYSSFSGLTMSNVTSSFLTDGSGPQYNPGNPCDIVVVRAIYPMPIFLPTLWDTTLGKGVTVSTAGQTNYGGKFVQMLTAASVFRNEPYVKSSGQSTAGCS